MMMSIEGETTRIAKWRMQREVKAEKIKLLWADIERTQEQYADLGARDSEPDQALQGMVFGMSYRIPVSISKSPKQYFMYAKERSDNDEQEQLNQCAKEFSRLLREIKKEWKWFDHQPIPETLTEFLKEKCWRFHM
jgi:hypothetical protein